MAKIIIERIITADGFAQDTDGGMKFMDAAPIDSADSDQLDMLSRVGAIVLGRRTYEMFAGYWPSVDPDDEPVASLIDTLPKHIVSTTLDSAPWGDHVPAVIRHHPGGEPYGARLGHSGIRHQEVGRISRRPPDTVMPGRWMRVAAGVKPAATQSGLEGQAQRARYCCTSARVSVFSAARSWCARR
jgi:hypothetical protein